MVLRVRKKGILILPKRLREEAGIGEGDDVLVEASKGRIVLKSLRPKVVDVDPRLLDELLSEEYTGEVRKHGEILGAYAKEDSS